MNTGTYSMITLDGQSQSRLQGRARAGAAPATVAVRLLRPSVARSLARPPVRIHLQSRAALGLTRSITITR
jgi:hypothetical protein